MKNVFFKIWQNLQETLVPEKTPVNFAKFLKTPSLQHYGRLLLKCGYCKNEAREIDCLCCKKLDASLLLRLKSHYPAFSHTC